MGWTNSAEFPLIYYYQESCPLSYMAEGGFLQAFGDAYINHGDVKITPDDIWITILLYFSRYVNDYS